jgi:hypothetical protein
MKSRHLNILDFLDKLQVEYYQADFRRSIHHSPKNKAYWKRVMEGKREKILDISKRSELANIFNDSTEADEYRSRVFPSTKSIGIKFELTTEEAELYYAPGSPVKVEVEAGKFITGKIEQVYFDNALASVRLRGRSEATKHLFSKFFRVF